MKARHFYVVLIIVIATGLFHLQSGWHMAQNHKEVMETIARRTHLDSLYWNHLEECSFIADDNIEIGWKGTLYSKYHKDGKITE